MLNDALKPMLDSGLLNEATKTAINEAWETKLVEARSEIRAEIRSEFAERYNHDKSTMVKAIQTMISEALESEISKIQAEKKAIVSERVKGLKQLRALSERFQKFMTTRLAEEIQELRQDRKTQKVATTKLENFVMKSLAEEITEFATDKRDLVETKVRLISEASKKLNELKARFVQRSSKLVQETVAKQLKKELVQLHEDISAAKRNNFGRKIFEAFASEFSATQLNENAEMRRLNGIIKSKNTEIVEAKQALKQRARVLESKDRELRVAKETSTRKAIMSELLGPLAKSKSDIMVQLLENVQTSSLRAAFDKYLPSVLNNSVRGKILTENKTEVTGNKTAKTKTEDNTNIIDMKRLAGL